MTIIHDDPRLRDLAGVVIELDSLVITTESNRIITGRIVKINERSRNVTVEPLMSTTGGRRQPPIKRYLTRAEHNVYVIPKGEQLFTQLRGYYHNTGEWAIRRPKPKRPKVAIIPDLYS